MTAGCGLISDETLHNHIQLIARTQHGADLRKLGSGAMIPPFAIPDHVTFEGGGVFYPGTYSVGEDQGGEPWGELPPVDDHYKFIHLAYLLWKRTRDPAFLLAQTEGLSLYDRLGKALDCPFSDPQTGLVRTRAGTRAVGFGFCDGIYFTGALLIPSLLRFRALGEMSELCDAANLASSRGEFQRSRKLIMSNLMGTFSEKGWLKAATEVGQQPDVWGSVLAVYLNAVKGSDKASLRRTICDALRRRTIIHQGAVRQVPTDHDYSKTSAWQQTGESLNRYQNGAYWHVPSGWLARVAWQEDKRLARHLVSEMIAHFREEDFRKGGQNGAPWECLHPDGHYRQNPIYMASITLPLEALTD